MSTDLITSAEMVNAWSGFSALATDEKAALLSAASRAVEGYLGRTVGSGTYDEVACPDGRDGILHLKHRPVTAITRISGDRQVVLSVTNTDTTNALATAEFVTTGDPTNPTYTGIKLTRIASGVASSSTTLAFATYPTLADMETAIEAVGNGWSATVASGYTTFPSSQLWKQVGARGAGATDSFAAEFEAFTEDLQYIETDPRTGKIQLYRWARSDRRVRIQYTAGYATADVPTDIKRATIATLRFLASPAGTGAGLKRSSFADREYELADMSAQPIPPAAKLLLGPYRDRRFL